MEFHNLRPSYLMQICRLWILKESSERIENWPLGKKLFSSIQKLQYINLAQRMKLQTPDWFSAFFQIFGDLVPQSPSQDILLICQLPKHFYKSASLKQLMSTIHIHPSKLNHWMWNASQFSKTVSKTRKRSLQTVLGSDGSLQRALSKASLSINT